MIKIKPAFKKTSLMLLVTTGILYFSSEKFSSYYREHNDLVSKAIIAADTKKPKGEISEDEAANVYIKAGIPLREFYNAFNAENKNARECIASLSTEELTRYLTAVQPKR